MQQNAVLQLRAIRLAKSTRSLQGRGHRTIRCEFCLLPVKHCLCQMIKPTRAQCRFCLIMFDTEPLKPSNTGRLIADILPNTQAFSWSRVNPDKAMLAAVESKEYQPMLVFPASYASPKRQVYSRLPALTRPPLFILLDGTWSEARKMFRKSPWLDHLPLISLNVAKPSEYRLRVASHPQHHCTAEMAIALMYENNDFTAAEQLQQHFIRFRENYLAGKPSHSYNEKAFSG